MDEHTENPDRPPLVLETIPERSSYNTALPFLLAGTSAGMAFGYVVLGWFIRGPGDPQGEYVGTGLGGIIGLGFGSLIALLRQR